MLRHGYIATAEDSLLLIIDFQERLLKAMDDWQLLAKHMIQLSQAAALLDVPVVLTEQYKEGLGATAAQVLQAVKDPQVLQKDHFSACLEDDFIPALHATGRKKIIVAGMEAHVCVLQTCLDLLQAGFEVQVLADAVTSRSAQNKQTGLDLLRQAGAVVTSTETVIFQWTRRANTALFREILPIIK